MLKSVSDFQILDVRSRNSAKTSCTNIGQFVSTHIRQRTTCHMNYTHTHIHTHTHWISFL